MKLEWKQQNASHVGYSGKIALFRVHSNSHMDPRGSNLPPYCCATHLPRLKIDKRFESLELGMTACETAFSSWLKAAGLAT